MESRLQREETIDTTTTSTSMVGAKEETKMKKKKKFTHPNDICPVSSRLSTSSCSLPSFPCVPFVVHPHKPVLLWCIYSSLYAYDYRHHRWILQGTSLSSSSSISSSSTSREWHCEEKEEVRKDKKTSKASLMNEILPYPITSIDCICLSCGTTSANLRHFSSSSSCPSSSSSCPSPSSVSQADEEAMKEKKESDKEKPILWVTAGEDKYVRFLSDEKFEILQERQQRKKPTAALLMLSSSSSSSSSVSTPDKNKEMERGGEEKEILHCEEKMIEEERRFKTFHEEEEERERKKKKENLERVSLLLADKFGDIYKISDASKMKGTQEFSGDKLTRHMQKISSVLGVRTRAYTRGERGGEEEGDKETEDQNEGKNRLLTGKDKEEEEKMKKHEDEREEKDEEEEDEDIPIISHLTTVTVLRMFRCTYTRSDQGTSTPEKRHMKLLSTRSTPSSSSSSSSSCSSSSLPLEKSEVTTKEPSSSSPSSSSCCRCAGAREEEEDFVIFSADRDEKIRASLLSRPWEIQSFFLGHSDFITDVLLLRDSRQCNRVSSSSSLSTIQDLSKRDIDGPNKKMKKKEEERKDHDAEKVDGIRREERSEGEKKDREDHALKNLIAVSSSADGSIQIWRVEDGQLVKGGEEHNEEEEKKNEEEEEKEKEDPEEKKKNRRRWGCIPLELDSLFAEKKTREFIEENYLLHSLSKEGSTSQEPFRRLLLPHHLFYESTHRILLTLCLSLKGLLLFHLQYHPSSSSSSSSSVVCVERTSFLPLSDVPSSLLLLYFSLEEIRTFPCLQGIYESLLSFVHSSSFSSSSDVKGENLNTPSDLSMNEERRKRNKEEEIQRGDRDVREEEDEEKEEMCRKVERNRREDEREEERRKDDLFHDLQIPFILWIDSRGSLRPPVCLWYPFLLFLQERQKKRREEQEEGEGGNSMDASQEDSLFSEILPSVCTAEDQFLSSIHRSRAADGNEANHTYSTSSSSRSSSSSTTTSTTSSTSRRRRREGEEEIYERPYYVSYWKSTRYSPSALLTSEERRAKRLRHRHLNLHSLNTDNPRNTTTTTLPTTTTMQGQGEEEEEEKE
ncbi:wd g-beta repeat-containing protein [Cystoisospora suis]|uniref:Wd g-beta repeat-containing protein n=1 Tax=Cystoisospora suis TaxID=483139 RepID=A0A2C6KP18_9APIC|nr:wd g-beta repeat-containing protein [Cystoisospora suis]